MFKPENSFSLARLNERLDKDAILLSVSRLSEEEIRSRSLEELTTTIIENLGVTPLRVDKPILEPPMVQGSRRTFRWVSRIFGDTDMLRYAPDEWREKEGIPRADFDKRHLAIVVEVENEPELDQEAIYMTFRRGWKAVGHHIERINRHISMHLERAITLAKSAVADRKGHLMDISRVAKNLADRLDEDPEFAPCSTDNKS